MTATPPTPSATPVPVIEPPRTHRAGHRPRPRGGTGELYGWLFLRVSGVLLVVLVLGHLLVQLVLGGGVSKVSFAYVAGRWASPLWQTWDLLMLWLALPHGCAGLRTIITDYARRDATRLAWKLLLYTATAVTLLLGTLVILTFDPNLR